MAEDKPADRERRMCLRLGAVDWLDVEDEIVALDGERSVYLSVNSSGTILWRHLAEGATFEDLVEALTDAYGIPEDAARADVGDFVETLSNHNLIEFL